MLTPRRRVLAGLGGLIASPAIIRPATAAFATHMAGVDFRVLATGVSLSHTGDTNLFTLATVTIPGRAMGAAGQVRVTTVWDYTNSVNVKTLIISFGGTVYYQVAPTTTLSRRSQCQVKNLTTGTQVGGPSGIDGFTTATTALITSSVDTNSDVSLLLRCQLASSGETITLDSYLVELAGS